MIDDMVSTASTSSIGKADKGLLSTYMRLIESLKIFELRKRGY